MATIKIKNHSDVVEEYSAGGTITPGHLLKLNSSGAVIAHNVAGGPALRMFAVENEFAGKGVDDNYSSGEKVQVWFPQPGDEVYALLKASQNVSIGDFLESAGDGTLQKYSAASAGVAEWASNIVGVALVASNVGSVARIKVKVI